MGDDLSVEGDGRGRRARRRKSVYKSLGEEAFDSDDSDMHDVAAADPGTSGGRRLRKKLQVRRRGGQLRVIEI
jgi:hypothetical protein